MDLKPVIGAYTFSFKLILKKMRRSVDVELMQEDGKSTGQEKSWVR